MPILDLGAGGWDGMVRASHPTSQGRTTPLWRTMCSGDTPWDPLDGHRAGLGWVIPFGYWSTDFLCAGVLAAKTALGEDGSIFAPPSR
jgi:hypothetical protein